MRISAWRVAVVGLSVAFLLPVAAGGSDGDKRPAKGDKQSAHMQAMYATKQKIPEEYRIMDRTPVTPDAQSLARGKELFGQQCAPCHGGGGRGDGPAARGLKTAPADFLDLQHSAVYGPGEKYWLIGNGSADTGMPPFPGVKLKDRWHLVNYIYQLQESKKALPQGGIHHH